MLFYYPGNRKSVREQDKSGAHCGTPTSPSLSVNPTLKKDLTVSMVVHACLKGVVKQLGRGPPSLQMLDSISSLTESSNPRGCVACSEKYLGQGKETTQTGFAKLCKCSVLTCPPDTAKKPGPHWLQVTPPSHKQIWEPCPERWKTGNGKQEWSRKHPELQSSIGSTMSSGSLDGGMIDEPLREAFVSSPIIISSLGNNSSCGRASHLNLRTNISWKQLCCLSPSCLIAMVKHKVQEESSSPESLILKKRSDCFLKKRKNFTLLRTSTSWFLLYVRTVSTLYG